MRSCTNIRTHACTQIRTHSHAAGRGLSTITAQWNIFRLERCRITLQLDDKYAVSIIINLVPFPIFHLQTLWRKGKRVRGGTGWMESAGAQQWQCSRCTRRAAAQTDLLDELSPAWEFSQQVYLLDEDVTAGCHERSWHPDSPWLPCNVTVQKGSGCTRPAPPPLLCCCHAENTHTLTPNLPLACLFCAHIVPFVLELSAHQPSFPCHSPQPSLLLSSQRFSWHIALTGSLS